jgi:hypothetical protein
VLGVEPCQPWLLRPVGDLGLGPLGHRHRPLDVGQADRLGLVRLGQPGEGVAAHRVPQLVASLFAAGVAGHQRLVHQAGEDVQNRLGGQRGVAADALDGIEGAAVGEHGEAPQ